MFNMGLLGFLGAVFIVLKLIGISSVATWSWWLVLSPFMIWAALYFLVSILVALVGRR